MSSDIDDYGIQSELKVRGILEERTDWYFEFTKNDKYQVDMQLYDWGEPPVDADSRSFVGYIEVEVASEKSDWQTGDIPEYWNEISFLKRKIRTWDYTHGRWGSIRPKARETLYLKFNHELDNCFVAPVERVFHDHNYERTRGRAQPPSRTQDVYCLHPDHDSITWGTHDVIKRIEAYFDALDDDQHSLSKYAHTDR